MTDDGGGNYERCGTEDSTGDRDGCVEACEERSTGDHFAEDCDADDAAGLAGGIDDSSCTSGRLLFLF